MVDKEVKIKLGVDADDSQVDALEKKVEALKKEKIIADVQANSEELTKVQSRIDAIKVELGSMQGDVDVDDSEVTKLQDELAGLENKALQLEVKVATSELKAAKELEESLNDTVQLQVDVEGMESIKDGLSSAKQGVSDLAGGLNEIQQAGMQSEQNLGFLAKNLPGGMADAKQQMQEINDIVASMPGDDNTMRSVLSTAQALGNNLNPDEMRAATGTMADYMQGSATMGKQALESQQDIMKYLLDGNTAELERGSIVSSQVDKLKEATTFQERQKAMQEVLNDLGYGGIASLDTTINKQAEWEGMMYNSKDALSSMWLGAEKGAMDYIIKLNEATGGILGMAIVAGQTAAGPLVDLLGGIGEIGMGMRAIKDLGFIQWLRDFELMTKLSAAADWLLAGAQAVLNAIMSMNPIVLVVIALIALAAALIWAYQNVDWFREMVDGAWASLVQLGQYIYGLVAGAIQWLGQLFNDFTSQLGLNTNDWTQAILGFLLFIPQLPLQLGIALANAIAQTMGFGSNFVQRMVSSASSAVSGFANYIRQLPEIVMGEFNRVLGMVNDFINSIPSRVWDMGAAIIGALKSALGIGSPGHMFYMLEGEFERMEDLTDSTRFDTASIGQSMVDSFNPNLTGNMNVNGNNPVPVNSGTVINIYGDVDSEARVQQIIDVIRRELSWDNTKAGRTV